MNSRELVIRTLSFQHSGRIPRHKWILPWAERHHAAWVKRLQREFPDDITTAPAAYRLNTGEKGGKYQAGTYVDAWGCTFSNPEDGIMGLVKTPLIADWNELSSFRAPDVLLDVDREKVNRFCRSQKKFVLSGTLIRPFERLQFIRTMEQALMDLLEEPPELLELLEKIHQFYMKEAEAWARTDIDALYLMDDWGTQHGLLVSPDVFRRFFLPMYRDYVEIARQYGKWVFMHSDGFILDVIPDLIDAGVHALNSQVFCMGVEELGEKFRGKITFWGEVDRQRILPYGSRKEVKEAVQAVMRYLYAQGGVIAQSEFGPGARPENVYHVFETWSAIPPKKNVKPKK
ncbi:MAG: methyltransferase [Candidatus Aminicenantes bacterium]|nr:methyltransferase [Candidatus Aminicenantes bacterium]